MTKLLVGINLLVFLGTLISGAGLWHSSNSVQLAWGANFGPATQDGEWWRLCSAMFLHFGVIHLTLNLWALWDAGQLVERMYGHARFAAIYFGSGLTGNLLSLVFTEARAREFYVDWPSIAANSVGAPPPCRVRSATRSA